VLRRVVTFELVAAIAAAIVLGGCGLLLDLELTGDDAAKDAASGRDAGIADAASSADAAGGADAGVDASALDAGPMDGTVPRDATGLLDGAAVDAGGARPVNDRCETATDLSEGTTDGLSLCGATATLVALCSGSAVTAPDVFFRVPESGGTGAYLVDVVEDGYLIQEIDPTTCLPTGMCAEGSIHAFAGSIVAVERVDGGDDCGRTFSVFVSPM
jgi:hypothetical protein